MDINHESERAMQKPLKATEKNVNTYLRYLKRECRKWATRAGHKLKQWTPTLRSEFEVATAEAECSCCGRIYDARVAFLRGVIVSGQFGCATGMGQCSGKQ